MSRKVHEGLALTIDFNMSLFTILEEFFNLSQCILEITSKKCNAALGLTNKSRFMFISNKVMFNTSVREQVVPNKLSPLYQISERQTAKLISTHPHKWITLCSACAVPNGQCQNPVAGFHSVSACVAAERSELNGELKALPNNQSETHTHLHGTRLLI